MTNKELLQQMWLRQLHVLTAKTLQVREETYSFSVVPSTNFYWSAKICACSDSIAQRRQIGKLIKAELLKRWHIHYMQVYFDTDVAKAAFEKARSFWLDKGLPAFKDADGVTQNSKVIKPADLEQWQFACFNILVNAFPTPCKDGV